MKKPRLTREQILEALKRHEETLRQQYSVKRIGLFGSYARGQQKLASDIDFLVEFDQPSYDNFYDLCVFLEKLFDRKVDVMTPKALETVRVEQVAQSIRESLVYA